MNIYTNPKIGLFNCSVSHTTIKEKKLIIAEDDMYYITRFIKKMPVGIHKSRLIHFENEQLKLF